jgi:hypothetical protein
VIVLLRLVGGALGVVALLGSTPARAWEPFSLNDKVLPERFSLTVRHRTRYEYLDEQFRAGSPGNTDVIALRTLAHGRLRLLHGLWVGGELEDSRAERNGDTLLNTSIVNSVEALRAYLELQRSGVWGGTLLAQFGRITMDVGSRRFVARNRFRNTINGFTGIDLRWKSEGGTELRGFYTLPVRRLPSDRDKLDHNKIRNDEESFAGKFWGLFAGADLPGVGRGELFLFGVDEDDRPNRRTLSRELYTPGFRVFRSARKGHFDYQVETALQFGDSRTLTSGRQLDHFAHFHHAEVAYSFDTRCNARLVMQYDYASGDDDPNDGDNNRFDTLFGARRFDFGPTGIYGPFARANLHTPGVRVQLKPTRTLSSFLAFRGYWLADKRDSWVAAGVRDPSGKSGSYLGSQLELRVRWRILPGNLVLEAGFAHLFAGEFIDDAPASNDQGDSNYVYTQISIGF